MEHRATSTLIRVRDAEHSLDPLLKFPEVLGSPEAGLIPSDDGTSLGRSISNEGLIVFLLSFAAYLTVAVLLDFRYRILPSDAVSRMANGFYILYSRDTHLAAVGFVWTPLQSIADLVFLLGNHLWPDLSRNDMAGSLVSSLSMAGVTYQLCAASQEWGVSRVPRLVLAGCFVLNPMILYYSGNGMSEGLFMFTLVASTRYLLRWANRGDLRSLAYSAVILGLAYLARNEAATAIMAGAIAVAAISYWRTAGRRPSRVRIAIADVVIFAGPGIVAVVGWAITSYVITGTFAAQFSSQYGNSSQLQQAHLKSLSTVGRAVFEARAIDALGPLVPVVLVVSLVVGLMRRDPRVLVPLAVLGGAMGFDMLAYVDDKVFPWFRFYILTVPLEVLLVASVVAALQTFRAVGTLKATRPKSLRSRAPSIRAIVGVGIALVVMIPGIFTTASAMLNPKIGNEESDQLGALFKAHPSAASLAWKSSYSQIQSLSAYFARMHLPDGDIVVDNFSPCVPEIITSINQPKLFVIPNDRDFQRILADPISFHTHYILEPDPASFAVTATNIQYPGLWKTGAGFTRMVHQFPARAICPEFRLFHVLGHSGEVG